MDATLRTVAQLREIELRHASLPPGTLMQRAGAAAAAWIEQRFGARARRILVLCGPGNNGGDGYVCAAELLARNFEVRCVAALAPRTEDARAAAARFHAAGGMTGSALDGAEADLIVDALFGIGMQRPLDGVFAEQTQWLRAARMRGVPVVALDVPTGLDADSGAWVGDVAGVLASATVTFLAAKPGLYTGAGADAAGEVVVASLDVDANGAEPAEGHLNGPSQFASLVEARPRCAHKGSFGNVAIVGGNAGMVGAALLAARAALRLGAGRVYVDCVGAPELRVDPLQPELMFRNALERSLLDTLQALVVGCGLGTDATARATLGRALAAPCPVVIDADGLNLIATDAELNGAARAAAPAARVVTPHPLEAARLLGTSAAEVQRDRVGAARHVARSFGAWTVLKGAGSVVASPLGSYWINTTGSPALATAGTGDVLAGMLGALLAQGFPIEQTVLGAVWLHGRAAELYEGDIGLVAGEVAVLAARALNALRGSSTAS